MSDIIELARGYIRAKQRMDASNREQTAAAIDLDQATRVLHSQWVELGMPDVAFATGSNVVYFDECEDIQVLPLVTNEGQL